MSADNAPFPEPPIFSATITPHRSLGPVGFALLMAAVAGVSFFAGMIFLLEGAWPVLGFFALDALLLYWAFQINYRAAAAYEEVTVTPSELTLRQVSCYGQVREWRLNPLWVRLEQVMQEEFGVERLFLVTRGRKLAIASFLGPDEKASFAHALGRALSEARRGVTRTVL